MVTYTLYGLDSLDDLWHSLPHPSIIDDMERPQPGQGHYQRLPLPLPANSIYERTPLKDIMDRISPKYDRDNSNNGDEGRSGMIILDM